MPFVIGREATLTYSTGPETIITTKFNRVAMRISRAAWETTPPGYLMKRRTPGILDAVGSFGNWYDSSDTTPPIPGGAGVPSGTIGTLAFTATTGKGYSLPVLVTELSWQSQTEEGGPPQGYQYDFRACATTSTDTITKTG